ncbi:YraN family protein [Gallaecimonas kandeliae]|uniref:YraN family protein n=1 Tax=Gallaecimonas kandeliae TaxID=3029055 RepID=UPI002648E789|nr:YraN family protein [Gallaecimonas kandeliae]WKE66073.1 YraN family protein [Gallaecimonas kandeliae]
MSFRLFPSRTAKGRHFEQDAERWLKQQGLSPVARNVRYRGGELDLVMKEGPLWVFVEVKYRSQTGFGGAVHAISRAQQARLWQSARRFLKEQGLNEWDCQCRFDVVIYEGEQGPLWLKGAFGI